MCSAQSHQIGCKFLTDRSFPWNVQPSDGWSEFPRTLLLFATSYSQRDTCFEAVVGTTGLFTMKTTLIHAIIKKVVVVVFVPSASTVLVAFFRYVGSILALWSRTPHRALLMLLQKVKDHVPHNEDLVFKWCLTGQNEAKCVHKQYTTYWVESKHSTDSSSCPWPGTTAQVPSVNMLLKLWSWESTAQSLVCNAKQYLCSRTIGFLVQRPSR